MTTTYKTYAYNSKKIETAENDLFSWDNNINRDSLLHKATGQEIYQASWVVNGKMTSRIDDETYAQYQSFWEDLKVAQAEISKTYTVEIVTPEASDWYNINDNGERELAEDC